jgi:hypothetical protein
MEIIRNPQNTAPRFVQVGRAWKNQGAEGTKNAGVEYMTIALEQDLDRLVLEKGEALQLWPNNQRREGRNDAHYRVVAVGAPQPKLTAAA